MKKILSKLTVIALITTFLLSPVCSPVSLHAQETTVSLSSANFRAYEDLARIFENSSWGKQVRTYGKDRNIGTAAIKKALKWALHHEREIVKGAEKWIGKDAAERVGKVIYDISPTLHKLLKYEDLVWQTVQDQLTPIVGRTLAFWIAKVIEWIAPI